MSLPPPPAALVPRLRQVADAVRAGRIDQARQLLQRLAQHHPLDPTINSMLASLCVRAGQVDQALFFTNRALQAAPDHPGLLTDLAKLEGQKGRLAEAEHALLRALAREPGHVEASLTLAGALAMTMRLTDACDVCTRALTLRPHHPELSLNLALALAQLGEPARGADILREAARHNPGNINVLTGLGSTLNYVPGADPRETFAAHEAFGRAMERACPAPPRPARAHAGPRLRVGLMSPDLRRHSVAFFVEPVLRHLDRRRFEVWCYHTGPTSDEVTARLRAHADGWRDLPVAAQDAIARQIRADAVDILIELSGFTAGQTLAVLQMRPAPVQGTYIGYPNTTGMHTIDFRIVDEHTDPRIEVAPGAESGANPGATPGHEPRRGQGSPDAAQQRAVETLVRLDTCFLCFQVPEDAPEPRAGATETAPHTVTFGSFNALSKMNARVVAVWADLLGRVPHARLMLKNAALSFPEARRTLSERFARAGITPESGRLLLNPWADAPRAHLAGYNSIDVALDTFPYSGTTTTCEALLMGVPVVTLAGATHAGRVGVSLLAALSGRCAEARTLIARDETEYLDIACALANDAPRRAAFRSVLPGAMRASPVCDGPRFGANLGAALESIWTRITGAALPPVETTS